MPDPEEEARMTAGRTDRRSCGIDGDRRISAVGAPRSAQRLAGRAGALLAAGCLALHLPLIVAHLTGHPVQSIVMFGLSLACIPCLGHLWHGGSARSWAMAAVLALGMVALHLPMLLQDQGHEAHAAHFASGHGGHHAGPRFTAFEALLAGGVEPLLYAATVLAVLQSALAAVMLLRTLRKRRPRRAVA